ncbi:MAG: MBL fold metallo-hydrolase [Verrucomicrobiota bacterium]
MLVEFQELPPIGTNAFALIEPDLNRCVILDAPLNAYEWARSIAAKYDCEIEALILTHGHWDHILDGHEFAAAGIPTYGHKDDRMMFEHPELMASYAIPGIEMISVSITNWVEPGERLTLLGRSFEVRHVPGHCPGNILIYDQAAGIAVVGDVIFASGVGRYDLPGGDFELLESSIKNEIYSLPDETILYPGHGSKTTVGTEKRSNPFVRG